MHTLFPRCLFYNICHFIIIIDYLSSTPYWVEMDERNKKEKIKENSNKISGFRDKSSRVKNNVTILCMLKIIIAFLCFKVECF